MICTPKKRRLLVTGASGFLGWNLCKTAVTNYDVHGTFKEHMCTMSGVTMHHIDCTDHTALSHLFDVVNPEAVIHTAAAADPNYCQTHPEQSASINIASSVALAKLCAQKAIPFVYTSSDLVFDGKNAPYQESDPTCPLSLYGEQKAETEKHILAQCSTAIICRMPLMYGDAPAHAKSFIHPMVAALKSGRELKLFTDEFRTPCSAIDASKGLLLAAEKMPRGIYHLGGPQRLSRYDIGSILAQSLRITPKITPCRQKDIQMAAPRAADVSMNSTKATNHGFAPRPMASQLTKLSLITQNIVKTVADNG